MQMYFNDDEYYVFNKKKLIKCCNAMGIVTWKTFLKSDYTWDDALLISNYFDVHGWHYLTRRIVA